jgi:hypothetical protein
MRFKDDVAQKYSYSASVEVFTFMYINEYQEFSRGGGVKGRRPTRKADNLSAISEPIV